MFALNSSWTEGDSLGTTEEIRASLNKLDRQDSLNTLEMTRYRNYGHHARINLPRWAHVALAPGAEDTTTSVRQSLARGWR